MGNAGLVGVGGMTQWSLDPVAGLCDLGWTTQPCELPQPHIKEVRWFPLSVLSGQRTAAVL